ncbi:hypothetical protein K505DRAFT_78992 [Melanomma pulvis-pyrius CBS 109.77]|uniref:Uncharacterized protein n=1 Tax=Melanomma pulvis-pyrius CBS 109.77 TaxID=1314802 RepID=A0A6A6X2E1_9PLEO|nr:hypothetical protein K505DRAFT_78992 [Melanomma pulvis-pyrius CBS 109.77]
MASTNKGVEGRRMLETWWMMTSSDGDALDRTERIQYLHPHIIASMLFCASLACLDLLPSRLDLACTLIIINQLSRHHQPPTHLPPSPDTIMTPPTPQSRAGLQSARHAHPCPAASRPSAQSRRPQPNEQTDRRHPNTSPALPTPKLHPSQNTHRIRRPAGAQSPRRRTAGSVSAKECNFHGCKSVAATGLTLQACLYMAGLMKGAV